MSLEKVLHSYLDFSQKACKLLTTSSIVESKTLDHEKLFRKACETAQLAGHLLTISGGLLTLSLATCNAATESGGRVTKTIASLKQESGTNAFIQTFGANWRSDLKDAAIAAQIAAREAASAALDIRKIIGGPYANANWHARPYPSATLTLVEIEEMLKQLSEQAVIAGQTWTAHKKEMAAIASGILSMLEMATRNKMVAVEAAKAAERLHIHAINFVRKVERSGLS